MINIFAKVSARSLPTEASFCKILLPLVILRYNKRYMKIVLVHASKKYLYTTVSIVALVAYSFIAFAAAPVGGYTPGAVLDPTCAPGSTSPNPCIVNISATSGLSYGGTVTSGHDNEVLYVDGAGNLASDAGFTRAALTGFTSLSADVNTSALAALTIGDTILGLPVKGISQSYTSANGNNFVITGDFSSVGGRADQTVVGFSNFGGLGAIGTFAYDSGIGSTIVFQTQDTNGATSASLSAGGFVVTGKDSSSSSRAFMVKDGSNNKLFAVADDGSIRINDSYTLPTTDGTNGYVLTTDGSGGVSWQAGGGGGGTPLPSQTGNSGKYLTTNGTSASWATLPSSSFNLYREKGTGGSISAGGTDAVAIGPSASAAGDDSIAISAYSSGTTASGTGAVSIGGGNSASSDFSYILGLTNTINTGSTYSMALGLSNTITGGPSYTFGSGNTITASNSTALGRGNSITGNQSFAFGEGLVAPSFNESAFGTFNTDYTPANTLGRDNTDRLFTIGNGSDNLNRSDVLTILKSGFTHLSADVNTGSPAGFDISDALFGFPLKGSAQSYVTSAGKNLIATGDFSSVGGPANETFLGFSDFTGNSAIGVFDYDAVNGSAIRFEASDSNGDIFATLGTNSGFVVNGKDQSGSSKAFTVKDSGNNKLFQIFDDGTVKVDDSYTLPTSDGAAGYLLSTNGSGAVGWTAPTDGFTTLGTDMFAGQGAGSLSMSGNYNTFTGINSGNGITSGSRNSFFGYHSGILTGGGFGNAFFGDETGIQNIIGNGNTIIGSSAGAKVTSDYNVFIGYGSAPSVTTGIQNVMIGAKAGTSGSVVTGTNNVFIGYDSANGNTADVSGAVLIGTNTSSGSFSNSIALGAGATNTAANQLMIGSVGSPINDMIITGTGFTSCTVDTGTGAGISCSSDERLKKNITDLGNTTLDTLLNVRTVTYNWKAGADTDTHIGFIAQDLQRSFPQLVSTAPNGYFQVNYAGMTPILTESIRELNLKISNIEAFAADSVDSKTFLQNLIAWLGSAGNGITALYAKTVHSTDSHTNRLCVGDASDETCITKDQLDHLLQIQATQVQVQGGGTVGGGSAAPSPAPADTPAIDPVTTPDSGTPANSSSGGDAASNDPVTPAAPTAPSDSADPAPAPVVAPDPAPVSSPAPEAAPVPAPSA